MGKIREFETEYAEGASISSHLENQGLAKTENQILLSGNYNENGGTHLEYTVPAGYDLWISTISASVMFSLTAGSDEANIIVYSYDGSNTIANLLIVRTADDGSNSNSVSYAAMPVRCRSGTQIKANTGSTTGANTIRASFQLTGWLENVSGR